MRQRLAPLALITLVFAACSSGPPPAPPAPPPLDPTGTWDVSVEAQGMSLSGVMVIRGSAEEGYTGSIDTDMGGASVADIVVDGDEMTMSIPDAGAQAILTFDGDEFTGELSGAMGDAVIFGTRREGG